MRKPLGQWCLLAICLFATPALAQSLNGAAAGRPVRIVLLVDSSTAVAVMLNQFRAGLNAFIDAAPEDAEIAFITTGGQIRIRTQPTSDRQKLHKAASGFASDGGANAFLETMIESDQRFLKKAPDRRPVFVILTSDNGSSRGEPRLDDYNKFVNDFLQRRGHAYGIVVRGSGIGPTSDIVSNLTKNTDGTYDVINTANSLPDKMKAIAARIAIQP